MARSRASATQSHASTPSLSAVLPSNELANDAAKIRVPARVCRLSTALRCCNSPRTAPGTPAPFEDRRRQDPVRLRSHSMSSSRLWWDCPGCDCPDLLAVDPFAPTSHIELSSRAVRDGHKAVKRVHAATNDVGSLWRGRLHEENESALADDRSHGVDAWDIPNRPRWPGRQAQRRAAAHRSPRGREPAPRTRPTGQRRPGSRLGPRSTRSSVLSSRPS